MSLFTARTFLNALTSTLLITGLSACGDGDPGSETPLVPERTKNSTTNTTTDVSVPWARVLEAIPDPTVVKDSDLRDAITKSGMPWRIQHNSTGIELLFVPSGEFIMGKSPGDDQALPCELPAHRVLISTGFYIGRTEVTQQQWSKLGLRNPSPSQTLADERRATEIHRLLQRGYTQEEVDSSVGPPPSLLEQYGQFPVTALWSAGPELCDFLEASGFQLPSEAQWEFACRAGVRTPRYGRAEESSWVNGTINPVAQLKPNGFGLHDMLGNAMEICLDSFFDDAYTVQQDGITDPISSKGNTPARQGFGGWSGVRIRDLSDKERDAERKEATRLGISPEAYRERQNMRDSFTESRTIRGGFSQPSCRASWRGSHSLFSSRLDFVGVRVIRATAGLTIDWGKLEISTLAATPPQSSYSR